MTSLQEYPHRRYNILTGEWVLVSPHRTKRPWQGKSETPSALEMLEYDESCYLCPGNNRAGGVVNPNYVAPYVFTNDFAALLSDTPEEVVQNGLFQAKGERGICRVVCFSENHSLTLPLMTVDAIEKVISVWQDEYVSLGEKPEINYVQIFENKGAIMGCSNPHPHGQIWSQSTIPEEVNKKTTKQLLFWEENEKSLLEEYIEQELIANERIIFYDKHFVVLVPYWAIWPYETMIIPRRKIARITDLTEEEKRSYAIAIKKLTIKYDNIFQTSFPYSSGIHQAPTDGLAHPEWHMHMSFYPPLLRSATVKKFMVGYELFANPQRDITAEQAAKTIRNQSDIHYSIES